MAYSNPPERELTFNECATLINTIPQDGLIPVLFLMIGSSPGIAAEHQHEKPLFLQEIVKDLSAIHPYVILIDPNYTLNPPTLFPNGKEFHEGHSYPEGTWYIDPTPECHERVSFAYFAARVEDYVISKIIKDLHSKMSIAVWSFTGDTYGKRYENNPYVHIPPGNCMADTIFNINYHPAIGLNEDGHIVFYRTTQQANREISIYIMNKVFSSVASGATYASQEANVLRAFGFSYYILKVWLDKIKIMYSWTLQITTDSDHTRRRQLNKTSTEHDWAFLDHRIQPYNSSGVLRQEFINSTEHTEFIDFIKDDIKNVGLYIVKLDNMISMFYRKEITETYHTDLLQNLKLSETFFNEQYEAYFTTKKSRTFPQIFEMYLTECKKINPKLDPQYSFELNP
jgi:hypothetical protein